MRGFLQTGIVAAVFGLVGMCGGCNPTTSTVEGGTIGVGFVCVALPPMTWAIWVATFLTVVVT